MKKVFILFFVLLWCIPIFSFHLGMTKEELYTVYGSPGEQIQHTHWYFVDSKVVFYSARDDVVDRFIIIFKCNDSGETYIRNLVKVGFTVYGKSDRNLYDTVLYNPKLNQEVHIGVTTKGFYTLFIK